MKRKTFLKILPATFLGASAFAAKPETKGNKMLVVYYSWRGNTRVIAETVQKLTGADMLEILPETPYPAVYGQTVDIAKKETDAKYCRPVKTKIPDLSDYDTVFVGSPNWWGTVSSPIRTFLTQAKLAGKNVVPFMTHEGSRMGRAVSDIKTLCPNSKILEALPVRGGSVRGAEKTVAKWLDSMKLAK